jgi:hypothetical protein
MLKKVTSLALLFGSLNVIAVPIEDGCRAIARAYADSGRYQVLYYPGSIPSTSYYVVRDRKTGFYFYLDVNSDNTCEAWVPPSQQGQGSNY